MQLLPRGGGHPVGQVADAEEEFERRDVLPGGGLEVGAGQLQCGLLAVLGLGDVLAQVFGVALGFQALEVDRVALAAARAVGPVAVVRRPPLRVDPLEGADPDRPPVVLPLGERVLRRLEGAGHPLLGTLARGPAADEHDRVDVRVPAVGEADGDLCCADHADVADPAADSLRVA
ncbi:hypothetical protein, partial [Streptomyces rochei]|uniref:hypothetical protein n=1 Tax=Streptomyces rochei TaxID=1928 RepID=UPI00363E3FF3